VKQEVSYSAVNSYETMNQLGDTTKFIWVVFHGMGYLSRYFLRKFQGLSKEENFIVAPQAPSKYYLDDTYTKIGASWLTREQTDREIENILSYLDAVYETLNISSEHKLVVFGFSQGVSIASRWVARRQIKCSKLILYSGGLPDELGQADFEFLDEDTEVVMIRGDQDPYIQNDRLVREKAKIARVFQSKAQTIVFEGGHTLIPSIIESIHDPKNDSTGRP